jgi:hypothetical protein
VLSTLIPHPATYICTIKMGFIFHGVNDPTCGRTKLDFGIRETYGGFILRDAVTSIELDRA